VVATLVKLRFLLLANLLRKSVWQLILVIVGALYALGILALLVVGLIALSFASIEQARTATVLAGGALVLGWIIAPLLASGVDQTVDPARLVAFPIPLNSLLVGLAVSGVLGVPGIVTSVAALATAATWWHTPLVAAAALVCAAIGVFTCVVGSRLLAAAVSGLGAGRRFREAKGLVLFVPLILLGPILLGLMDVIRSNQGSLPRIADAVALTPFGAIWAVPSDLAAGRVGRAALEFGIGVLFLAVLVALWRVALARALETPARASAGSSSRRGLGLFGVFPGTPTGAVAARALTYWVRDPRYAQSLIVVPLVPVLILFYAGGADSPWVIHAMGPGIAFLMALSLYTDISYDNTAFALHLQTGVSGLADRLGRVLAMSVFTLPLILVVTVGTVWFTGSWELLPGLLGVSLGTILSGFGLSSVVSARLVLQVPAPGESPFASKPGGGFSLMIFTFANWAVLAVLVLPETVLALVGLATGNALFGWLALVTGLLLGGVLLVVGVRLGGRMLDERGAELLAQLQKQK
jgi:ABC-2 type transport system permease protein